MDNSILFYDIAIRLLLGWIINLGFISISFSLRGYTFKDLLKDEKMVYLALILSGCSYMYSFIRIGYVDSLFISLAVILVYFYIVRIVSNLLKSK